MKNLFFPFLFLLFNNILHSQNLVPDPGFEQHTEITSKWIFTGAEFDTIAKHWTAPNGSSPDILFEKAVGKMYPKREHLDLKDEMPRSGKLMIGIKTYGCASGYPHCREYVQAKLNQQLIVGETYYVEFWCKPTRTSIIVNNMGVVFSDLKINQPGDDVLDLSPVINSKNIIPYLGDKWYKISGTFTAESPAAYLIIGNFFDDKATTVKQDDNQLLKYAYYLIDDVLVERVGQDAAFDALATGEKMTLKNILFDTGKANLKPASFPELDRLIIYLTNNAHLKISIVGFTDNVGSPAANQSLSLARATAICSYLQQNGISQDRLLADGKGAADPVADNNTAAGREQNRRVEIQMNVN